MSSVLLLTPSRGLHVDVVEARRARLRDRIAARLLAFKLDGLLAEGVPPERSAALSLRARRLIDPMVGRSLARALADAMLEAREDRRSRGRAPIRVRAVRETADELEDLAHRLVSPRPFAAQGVAQVRLLLTDGWGPLYSDHADEDLLSAVRRARAALEPL